MEDYNKLFFGFDEYNRLLVDINSCLKMPDISDNGEVISAYSLYKRLNVFFEQFRIKAYNNTKLIRKLNMAYSR